MKKIILLFGVVSIFIGCNGNVANTKNHSYYREQIYKAEEDFKNWAQTKGIADAFYQFADDNATIKRENDTLIKGKENIKLYYSDQKYASAKVTWKPDFVEVSDDGTMAYTYGKYIWKSKDFQGKDVEFKGVFHTVWKRQKDGNWKYVWD